MAEENEKKRWDVVPSRYWGPAAWWASPSRMMREMERAMDEVWRDLDQRWPGVYAPRVPAVDVKDEGDKYVLEADLPGIDKTDVSVTVDRGVLEISAKREEREEEQKEGYIRHERGFVSYSRRLVLPEDADQDSVDAKLEEGVLKVQIMKKAGEADKKKKVEVK
ncbi:MAG TPA: Hsp20/alpha crystallin family protein [Methanomassiliicoccales archaeon]|nr:Hsp20/alpha crystallin family protein [Methanomassiliicoccales archaeon]